MVHCFPITWWSWFRRRSEPRSDSAQPGEREPLIVPRSNSSRLEDNRPTLLPRPSSAWPQEDGPAIPPLQESNLVPNPSPLDNIAPFEEDESVLSELSPRVRSTIFGATDYFLTSARAPNAPLGSTSRRTARTETTDVSHRDPSIQGDFRFVRTGALYSEDARAGQSINRVHHAQSILNHLKPDIDTDLMGIIQEDMPGKSLEDLPEELAEELLEEHVTLEVRLLRAQMALPRISEPYCIPQDNFDRVVNVDTILAELQRCGVTLAETELHEKTVEIFKYARKLFAALVCEGFGECILDFLEEGLCDEDMPFVRLELGGWDHRSRGAPFPILESRRYKGKALKCVATGKWTRYHLANFSSQQWWVLAPEEQEKARAEERQRWEE